VGIYNSNKELIASTTVSNSDALDGFFHYHALDSKVTLTKGATYFIAAVMGIDSYAHNMENFTVDSAITYNGSYYTVIGSLSDPPVSGTLAFPATAGAVDGGMYNIGPNMDVTPTPIPAAAWLLGSGLMGLVGIRRKKNH